MGFEDKKYKIAGEIFRRFQKDDYLKKFTYYKIDCTEIEYNSDIFVIRIPFMGTFFTPKFTTISVSIEFDDYDTLIKEFEQIQAKREVIKNIMIKACAKYKVKSIYKKD